MDTPEDQMADHLLRRDAYRLGDMVGDIEVGGPDSADHLRDGRAARVGLNGVPKEGRYHTNHDGKTTEVPSKGRTHGNWEWDV